MVGRPAILERRNVTIPPATQRGIQPAWEFQSLDGVVAAVLDQMKPDR
jgi:hypothetical protein